MNDTHPAMEDGSLAHLPLGRLPRRDDERTLRLAKYLDDAVVLPEIPATFDLTPKVETWPMYGNDRLGDCTIAAAGHLIQAWTAAAGALVTPEDALIEEAYIPGTGTEDTGRVELDVLNYWRSSGIAGDKIAAYVAVDPTNHDHLRAALYLFGGLYTGLGLPISAQKQAEWNLVGDGKTGDSAFGSWGGHAVPLVPFWDGEKLKIVTWGAIIEATLAFTDAYMDEVYAIISPDFLGAEGKTPQGFDLAALQADLEIVTNAAVSYAPATATDEQVEETVVAAPTEQRRVNDGGYTWNG